MRVALDGWGASETERSVRDGTGKKSARIRLGDGYMLGAPQGDTQVLPGLQKTALSGFPEDFGQAGEGGIITSDPEFL